MLEEYWTTDDDRSVSPTPMWASLRTAVSLYVEYYAPGGRKIVAREYYDLIRDPWQRANLLRDGWAGKDPDVPALSAQLARDRRCRGTLPLAGCP